VILRPQLQDVKAIGYYSGIMMFGLGLLMIIPLIVGIAFQEIGPALDFVISASLCLIFGYIMVIFCATKKELTWQHGMIVVSLSWLLAMLFGALPLYLSAHWKCYLDACFDAMSGFATT